MKTTIDIPDDLYKKAKIRAVERGQTLKQIVLESLEKELGGTTTADEPKTSYWARRKLLPESSPACRLRARSNPNPAPAALKRSLTRSKPTHRCDLLQ